MRVDMVAERNHITVASLSAAPAIAEPLLALAGTVLPALPHAWRVQTRTVEA